MAGRLQGRRALAAFGMIVPAIVLASAVPRLALADETRPGVFTATNGCALYRDPVGRVKHEEVLFPAVLRYQYTTGQAPGPATVGLPNRPFVDTSLLLWAPFQDGFCVTTDVCVLLEVETLGDLAPISLNPPVRSREKETLRYRYTTAAVPGPAIVDPPDRFILNTVLGLPSGPFSVPSLSFIPIPSTGCPTAGG